ncbi:MAG TPA: hypothetical protein VN442_26790 [Bryobacteraceae bacterium]|nr:hypothetical protein [Bryobacteraceae bacterium]
MRAGGFRLFAAMLGLGALLWPQEPGAATLSRAEKEHFLRTAKVLKLRHLGRGVTNSLRATLSDGQITHDAHIQSIDVALAEFKSDRGNELNFRDCWKFNVAGYRLGVLLGLENIPVSVERKVGGRTSAVTWWVDDVLMDESARIAKQMGAPNPDRWNRQMAIVRVFDQLIYNTDRNLRNLLITTNWDLEMIDHTRAFRLRKEIRNPENLTRCERVLLGRLRALTREDLNRELRPYLTRLEIEALLTRRDRIVEHFEQRVKEKGEAAVLYEMK